MKRMNNKGFSLIELMCTLIIMSILLGLGCLAMKDLMLRQKNQCVSSRIFHTLAYARTEAIKRNKIVSVCGSHDFQHCSVDWSKGYMVFVMDPQESVPSFNLLRAEKIENAQIHSNHQKVIKFRGDGSCLTRSTITIAKQLKIVIYDSGRARMERFV